ncbi:MAG TPA: hypothetical protein VG797_07395, partial [Phycisphaerales bacterium]|nr:hypothetical protein [Phycisphaerales bacterium]
LLDFFEAAEAGEKTDPLLVDLLWQSARVVLPTTKDERLVYALRRHCRKLLLAEDGDDLAPVITRIYGVEATRSFLATLMEKARDDNQKQQIGKVQQKY